MSGSHAAAGPLPAAAEIKALLIQELRQPGRTTMHRGAAQAEARGSAGLQAQDATVRAGHRYRHNRLGCQDAPGALALGLPMGSGMNPKRPSPWAPGPAQAGRHGLAARARRSDRPPARPAGEQTLALPLEFTSPTLNHSMDAPLRDL